MNRFLKVLVDWVIIVLIFAGTILSPLLEKYLGLHALVEKSDYLIKISIWVVFAAVLLGLLIYLFLREGAGVLRSSSLFWLLAICLAVCVMLSQAVRAWDRLHFVAFWVLSFFLFRALRNHTKSKIIYFLTLAIVAFFAVIDEFNEALVFGRNFSTLDLSLNLLSATFYITVIALVIRPKLDPIMVRVRHQVDELGMAERFLKSFHKRKR